MIFEYFGLNSATYFGVNSASRFGAKGATIPDQTVPLFKLLILQNPYSVKPLAVNKKDYYLCHPF